MDSPAGGRSHKNSPEKAFQPKVESWYFKRQLGKTWIVSNAHFSHGPKPNRRPPFKEF